MKEFIKKFIENYGEEIEKKYIDNFALLKKCEEKNINDLLQKGMLCADKLMDRKLDYKTVLAALYYDVYKVISDKLFDYIALESEVGDLLKSVTEIDEIDLTNTETEGENLRNMLVAMAKDIRVIFIKLNQILLKVQNKEEDSDTFYTVIQDIYIPIAARLGLSYIKSELQDLSLQHFHPIIYKQLVEQVGIFNENRKQQIEIMKMELSKLLTQLGIKGEIYGRVKHISSVYNKLQQKHLTLEQIYDLSAVRILVTTKEDCYAVLGAVHTSYSPIDGRFKDYIASPKENGYQSLHTSVIMKNGEAIEIQIRTFQMHEHAEYGIAAHFLYKEHKAKKASLDDRLLWIRQLVENRDDLSAEDIIAELKTDLYSNEIFVQTPMGKIIKLVEGSTPIDFAYQIHSNIGDKCVGAKINGKMMPLATLLDNGDTVEIITNPNSKGPSRDWLKIVKGISTKSKINAYFKREMKDDNIKKGKAILENTAKAKGIQLVKLLETDFLDDVLKRYSFKSLDDMFASVGYGGITGTQIINKLIGSYKDKYINQLEDFEEIKPEKLEKEKNKSEIIVKGVNNLLLRFAHCCNPIPGDAIVGFFSRGRGVTIHRTDCPNLADMEQSRLSPAVWGDTQTQFPVSLNVKVNNLTKSINEITSKLNSMKITLQGLSTINAKNNNIVSLTIMLSKTDNITDIIQKLSQLPNVIELTRKKR